MCGVEVAGGAEGERLARRSDYAGPKSHDGTLKDFGLTRTVPSLAAPGTLSSLRQFRQIFDEGQGLLENLGPLLVQPDPLSPAFFGLAEPVPIASLHTLLDGLNPNVDPAGNVKSAAANILSLLEVLLDKYGLA